MAYYRDLLGGPDLAKPPFWLVERLRLLPSGIVGEHRDHTDTGLTETSPRTLAHTVPQPRSRK